MRFDLPQVVYLMLVSMSLGVHLVNNGKPTGQNYSVFYGLIANGIVIGVLYWGGFFT